MNDHLKKVRDELVDLATMHVCNEETHRKCAMSKSEAIQWTAERVFDSMNEREKILVEALERIDRGAKWFVAGEWAGGSITLSREAMMDEAREALKRYREGEE